MFVKSLRLAGFKSFADPTTLEFEPGVNVIVGPNGSGKSNIGDALSWVLGSQAPTSLRGGSMEDVIFAGSGSRPRLGMAQVDLTLDNSSGVLPLDLSEVTISRVTDRSGESEYRINGAPCRLLDVTELLSDTGIGRTLHAVVGQGQLDAVLQARPEERRSFIEEAAQIGKFRRRKDRALRKLERVEDNLVRLNDMLSELRRAIRPLKRQVGAASLYSELMIEHRELRQRLTATEIHRLAAEEERAGLGAEEHRVGLLTEELDHVRARLDSAASERDALALAAERAQRVANGIARAAERLASLRRIAQERSATIAARLAAETEEGYRERIRLLEADRARWQGELVQLRSRAEAGRTRATDLSQIRQETRLALIQVEQDLAEARAREAAAAEALMRAEGSEAAGKAILASVEARVDAAHERRDVTRRELETIAEEMAGSEAEVRRLEADLDGVTESAAYVEARLEEARTKVAELRRALGATEAERAAADARVAAFEEVAALFADRTDVVARIAPLLEDARTSAQTRSLSEADAARALAAAEAVVEERWMEVGRQDEELRRVDALVSGAAERLAGQRRRYESRETELAARDEELARAQEALAAAELDAVEERAALPARGAEWEEARGLREQREAALQSKRTELDEASRAANDAELDARSAEERSLGAQLRVEEAEAGIADAQRALEGLAGRRAALTEARRRAEWVAETAGDAAQAATRWAEQAESRASAAVNSAHEADRRLASLRARERELEENLEETVRRRNDAEVRRAQTRARADALEERSMEEWGLSLDALKELASFRPEEEQAARTRVEDLEREMRRLGAVNPRAAEEYEELAERERFLVEQIEDLTKSRADLMKIVREVDQSIVEVFGSAYEDVAREFEIVFDRLFPGGTGRLQLTRPDDLLETGIEIEARPAGKNVRKLSLLSGGERSLVALAFLFAIFRARPSPFYLLDEVEAALDDINLNRFLGLIAELEARAQVLVVTHQKRTMEAADVLYGVTMGRNGVSTVVAKRMAEVPA